MEGKMDREAFEALMDFAAGIKPDEIHYGFGLRIKDAQVLCGVCTLFLEREHNPHVEALKDRLLEFLMRKDAS